VADNLELRVLMTARLIGLADQLASDGHAPVGFLVRDDANVTTVCRFFQSRGQWLALTVVSADPHVDATALDAVVPRIQMALVG
jgi:hypothetical protein